ncbi:MAG: GAF and ANTAR domain-containing protein [Candidatus Omnitrophota bacterium]|nr:GAF and ANTAR domain-containing protein [Candidatus Omnitrophota bacterium]
MAIKNNTKGVKGSSSYERQIEALSKISQTITSNLYLEDILRLIVMVTAEVMNSKICSLMLIDEKGKELVIRATQSISEAYNKKPNIKIGEGIAGIVAKENSPIAVFDVRKDPQYINRDIAKKENLCSLLSLPMSVKGRVIGVLNSYTSTPHKFTKNEINILTTVANQAAVAIENAQLMVKSKIIQEELETRKLVDRAKGILMRKGLTEEDAFRRIQKQAMDLRRSMRQIAEAIILSDDLKY